MPEKVDHSPQNDRRLEKMKAWVSSRLNELGLPYNPNKVAFGEYIYLTLPIAADRKKEFETVLQDIPMEAFETAYERVLHSLSEITTRHVEDAVLGEEFDMGKSHSLYPAATAFIERIVQQAVREAGEDENVARQKVTEALMYDTMLPLSAPRSQQKFDRWGQHYSTNLPFSDTATIFEKQAALLAIDSLRQNRSRLGEDKHELEYRMEPAGSYSMTTGEVRNFAAQEEKKRKNYYRLKATIAGACLGLVGTKVFNIMEISPYLGGLATGVGMLLPYRDLKDIRQNEAFIRKVYTHEIVHASSASEDEDGNLKLGLMRFRRA